MLYLTIQLILAKIKQQFIERACMNDSEGNVLIGYVLEVRNLDYRKLV